MVIVHIPFHKEEGAGKPSALSSMQELRSYFRQEITEYRDGNWTTYVFPGEPSEETAGTYYKVLTGSPVVYILTFRQTADMKRRHWLGNTIEGAGYEPSSGKYDSYNREYVAYVGETNDIVQRTDQHLAMPQKGAQYGDGAEETYAEYAEGIKDRKKADHVLQKAIDSGVQITQYIIWDTYFTKSMTLDMENKFIDYLHAVDDVYTLNGRGNPQPSYYMSEEKDAVCSHVWRHLSLFDPNLFPEEQDIWNSELYKVSPFHALGKQQDRAVTEICAAVLHLLAGEPACGETAEETSSDHRLIIVEGASGTGKSIVLSTLFLRLSEALLADEDPVSDYGIRPNSRVALIVNQDQQLTLYQNLAKKIGLLRSNKAGDRCVYKATTFLNDIDSGKREVPDVVLVDEAHLLRMDTERFNYNKASKQAEHPEQTLGFHGNQLYDILLRAKIVIAVFDPVQTMRRSQQWDTALIEHIVSSRQDMADGHLSYSGCIELHSNGNSTEGKDTFNAYHLELSEQFRIDAGDEIIAWIDRLADPDATGIDPIPADTIRRDPPQGVHGKDPYDIRVFSSPCDLAAAIARRQSEMESQAKKESRIGGKGKKHAVQTAPLCRMLATYDWGFDKDSSEGYVELYAVEDRDGHLKWEMPIAGHAPEGYKDLPGRSFREAWNYTYAKKGTKTWVGDEKADREVGSYFSVQGFDLNYAAVIIGPSIAMRDGKIVVDQTKSFDSDVKGPYAKELILQQLKVLLRRGIHGLYLLLSILNCRLPWSARLPHRTGWT
jgi:hypothetical protein